MSAAVKPTAELRASLPELVMPPSNAGDDAAETVMLASLVMPP